MIIHTFRFLVCFSLLASLSVFLPAHSKAAEKKVKEPIQVISPNGGQTVLVDQSLEILWNKGMYTSGYVTIELIKNRNVVHTIAGEVWNTGSHTWRVPNLPRGKDYRIRISSLVNPSHHDESDRGFSISYKPFKVKFPGKGDEVIDAYSTTTWFIYWEKSDGGSHVKIILHKYTHPGSREFSRTIVERTENSGSFRWQPAHDLPTSKYYKVEIISLGKGRYRALSDHFFTLKNDAPLKIIYPHKDIRYSTLSPMEIIWKPGNYWNTSRMANKWVDIVVQRSIWSSGQFLMWSGQWPVAHQTENDGSFLWKIPEDVPSGDRFVLSIRSTHAPNIIHAQSEWFGINNEGQSIEITHPNKPVIWHTGGTYQITWKKGSEKGYLDNIAIVLQKAGKNYRTISAKLENTGYYQWTIPQSIDTGDDYSIMLHVPYHSYWVRDKSDEQFSIIGKPYIKLIYPNGGETVIATGPCTIKWDSANTSSEVFIALHKGQQPIRKIATSAESGQYDWSFDKELTNDSIQSGDDYWFAVYNKDQPMQYSDGSDKPFVLILPKTGKDKDDRYLPNKHYRTKKELGKRSKPGYQGDFTAHKQYNPLNDPSFKSQPHDKTAEKKLAGLVEEFQKQSSASQVQKKKSGAIGGKTVVSQSDLYTSGNIGTPASSSKKKKQQKSSTRQKGDSGDGDLSSVTVNSREVTITFWDHRDEDGDIINIYLNNRLLKKDIRLKNKKQSFQLRLNPGKNIFEIEAVNEGTSPPNTASVQISNVVQGKSVQIAKKKSGQKAAMTLTAPSR